MILLFWSILFLLAVFALAFFLPWVRHWRLSVFLSFFLSLSSLCLYLSWGSSRYLGHYYSDNQPVDLEKQRQLRSLLTEFRKQEFRLRYRLEENPKDKDAEWRLYDLLAIKALESGEKALARQYWEQAIQVIPNTKDTDEARKRIKSFLRIFN